MGANCPSLCIKMMHKALFIKLAFKVLSVLLHSPHGSIKVAANISQRNKEQAIKILCDISNVPRVQLATLVEYSPNNHHQAIAFNIQRLPLLHRKKV
jgi:predicted transglutaminase-like protease